MADNANSLEGRLETWHRRHAKYSPLFWKLARLLYHAEGFGPQTIKGPAVVVSDSHTFSADAVMPSYFKMYLAMIARRDRTLLSFSAHYGGGPTFDENNRTHVYLFKQLLFLLKEKQVVGLFPFSDVHNGKPQHKVLEATLKWEAEGRVSEVGYYAATTVYSTLVPFAARPARLWPSCWPVPLITSARILVSDKPVFAKQLPEESRNAEGLVAALTKESSELPAKYFGR